MTGIREELRIQRWDDYRFYHQSRINQTLHFFSAIIFLYCYATIFKDPATAGFIGWLAMLTRQTGHFFFEPNGYDNVNMATNEHKEEIKVGYNQRRKIVLLTVWALSPFVLYFNPTLFGIFAPPAGTADLIRHIGEIWLMIGIGGGLFRMVQLFFLKGVQTGLVWVFKVLTDPFHNIVLYYKSPLALLRGELIDPAVGVVPHWSEAEVEQAPRSV